MLDWRVNVDKNDCPSLWNKENITRLKDLERLKAESHQKPFCTCVNCGDFYCL